MIVEYIKKYSLILKNASYLTLMEVFKLLMPFVSLPYIISTIGADNYGLIVYVQTFISYFIIFINFGLDISAVKEVSQTKSDKVNLNRIVSSVLIIKLGLLCISSIILLVAILFIPFCTENLYLMIFSYLIVFSEVLFPIWYYQGIEKMQFITIIRFTTIALYTVSIFVFIHTASDYLLVPLLQSISSIIGGLICAFLLITKEKIKFCIPPFAEIKRCFKESIPFFTSRVSIVINSSLGKITAGALLSMELVAAYDIVQKIANMALTPMHMLNQAVYPHIAKTQDKKFAGRFLFVNIIISLIVALGIFILSPFIIHYFAKDAMPQSVELLRIFTLFIVFAGITVYLGSPVLVAFGHPRPFNMSILYSTSILLLIYAFFYVTKCFNIYVFAFVAGFTELFIMLYRFYYCMKLKLFVFSWQNK